MDLHLPLHRLEHTLLTASRRRPFAADCNECGPSPMYALLPSGIVHHTV